MKADNAWKMAGELRKLAKLRDDGIITAEEFAEKKRAVLGSDKTQDLAESINDECGLFAFVVVLLCGLWIYGGVGGNVRLAILNVQQYIETRLPSKHVNPESAQQRRIRFQEQKMLASLQAQGMTRREAIKLLRHVAEKPQ